MTTRQTKRGPRKGIAKDVETKILTQSGRRCALCFLLDSDLREKLGQIAHLDGDGTNRAEENLAFLCLNHHSIFDSKTSQHKNYTIEEVKTARSRLCKIIVQGTQGVFHQLEKPWIETDRKALRSLLTVLSRPIEFLRGANFAGCSFNWEKIENIETFAFEKRPELEFLDPELEASRRTFQDTCLAFIVLLSRETFAIGSGDRQGVPEDWETDQPNRFKRVVKEIHESADHVCLGYDEFVRATRRKLSA